MQNRCYADQGWDWQVREFCSANITYQGFSLLTANRLTLRHPVVLEIAGNYERAASDIIFRFALEVGMIPLTGTTSSEHMRADLDVFDFRLTPHEVRQIERVVLA